MTTLPTAEELYEIERGKPMPSKNHARIERRLNSLLTPYEDRYDIMPELSLKLKTGEATPDLCLYPKMEYDFEQDVIKMTEPPLTTFEILSPTQILDAVVDNIRKIYFKAGVRSAWLILPSLKTVYVLIPGQKIVPYTEGTIKDTTNGIEIPVNEIFK